MGSTFDQQEIINTPEAKGMRIFPSSRGLIVRADSLVARRGVGLKPLRSVPVGHTENPIEYSILKTTSQVSPDAARALQLLQVDTSKQDSSRMRQSLRLQVEFAGLDDTEITRPDCQIASGRDWLIVTVNAAWGVFDRAGRQLLRRNFTDMFAELIDDSTIFSPKVIYDHFRDGWVMVACARALDQRQSWLLLAYSLGSDPLGDWWIWALDVSSNGSNRSGHWADGIGLSVDNSSLYLTSNIFNSQGQFLYANLRILNKKDLQTGGVLREWDFWQLRNLDGSAAFGLQPAINLRPASAQYLLNALPDGQGLTQWTISQPPHQPPILSRRFIPTVPFQIAPSANQPTTDREIDTGDTRLGSVVFRHGLLWTAHTIAANWGDDANAAAIQWFQINPRTGCLTQQGIYGAPHYHYFSPAVMPDGEGNMIMVFNRAGEAEMPEIRFTGRCLADEGNTLQESVLLQQSPSAGGIEWSPFSGIASPPEDSDIWLIGQYAVTESDWATWIGSVTY
ncbi:MAG: hypothetical protein L0226_06005 [Acidobacteria bacterium]|nr:hypothetical protein [Acidobacteriota bacterium]